MPGLFSRLKSRDGAKSKKKLSKDNADGAQSQKLQWQDAYARKFVEPEEVHELLHCCTKELKARALDLPFLLLPFRPTSDPSAVRTFIRHFFDHAYGLKGDALLRELRMTEPMVISGVTKWCWSRLQGGVVGSDAYELFKVGELDSNNARNAFKTFIPISVENGARQRIIFDFFDLIAAVAAHGKSNGFGGRQLSRLAAWWAFEFNDTGSGFDGGYKTWLQAADATSHLFFAYLRSLTPEQSPTGISLLPRSLEKLLKETPYPPPRPQALMSSTNKLVMIVDCVSPTPFALLRRAGHFQYRDSDRGLQEFSEYEDPVQALTEECLRVLRAISAANQSQVSSSKHSTSLREASWSRFEDLGFGSTVEEEEEEEEDEMASAAPRANGTGLRRTPASGSKLARPMTPSWADFLSSGFDDNAARSNLLLPPDKVLPPIESQFRQHSSQSHRPRLDSARDLEPGELASITVFDLDDVFWWVWMSSLAPEETAERKSAFGRCAMIETRLDSSHWIIMEEMIAGAAPEPQEGAYIAEKKRFFSWTKRNRTIARSKSTGRRALNPVDNNANRFGDSKTSIGPETHAKIQAKAAQLRAMTDREQRAATASPPRRGRTDAELIAEKTSSILTLQPTILGEASSAMKWVKKYDKGAIKDAYMANSNAGRGFAVVDPPHDEPRDVGPEQPGLGLYHAPAVPTKVPEPARDPTPYTTAFFGPQPRNIKTTEPIKTVEPEPEPELEPEPEPKLSERVPSPAALSHDPHAAEAHPLPRESREGAASPVLPPPAVEPGLQPQPAPVRPQPVTTNSEPNKLHKNMPNPHREKSGGLRKLFARKHRGSKIPEDAAKDLQEMLRQQPSAVEFSSPESLNTNQPLPAPQEPPRAASKEAPSAAEDLEAVAAPAVPYVEEPVASPTPTHKSHNIGDVANPDPSPPSKGSPLENDLATENPTDAKDSGHQPEPSDAPSGEELAQVDTSDSKEAAREFSRFDQGPLTDQPGFVPEDEEDENDATPPPIARHPARKERVVSPPETPKEALNQSAGPGVQDRWAQIRKNAAERSANRQRTEALPKAAPNKKLGGEDPSGEETIESRVARIKARVAELTGNMEDSSQRVPPTR